MSSNPLVSVIVPIYNVEQYLDECLSSISKQTYRNIEIILIDDKSPDNCSAICNHWRQKDSRMTLVQHEQNKGLGAARNSGLDICHGRYVTFVDSDDCIAENMIEILVNAAIETSADIVACSAQQVNEDNTTVFREMSMPDSIYYNHEALEQFLYCTGKFLDSAWGKLYRTSLFQSSPSVQFPENLNSEDYYANALVLYKSNKVRTISSSLYRYRMRSGSICHAHFSARLYDQGIIGKMIQTSLQNLGYNSAALSYYVMQKEYDILFSLVGFKVNHKIIIKQKQRLLSTAKPVYHDKNVSLSRKIRIFLFSHVPRFYYHLNMLLH